MKNLTFLAKEIWKGKSVTRSFLNLRLTQESLSGKTIDVGGGKNPDYISFMKRKDVVEFVNFDIKAGAHINFETDTLPGVDGEYDTVLFLNVMEHIYNYQHIANEVVRIVKPGGQLIGFVPFLMWYHPDHSDFFRYTDEALLKIINKTGADSVVIESVSKGPFVAAVQMFIIWFPRFLRVPLFMSFYFLDYVFIKIRPEHAQRYALGYFFKIVK